MSPKLVAPFALASLVALSSACAAPPVEDGEDENVVEDAAAITSSVRAGTALVTTTRVRLREEASTSSATMTVLATGKVVKLVTGRAVNKFYEVEVGGERGFVFGTYLRPSEDVGDDDDGDEEPEVRASGSCVDARAAARIAAEAGQMDGRRSQGLCYRYVKNHIEDAGFMNRGEIPAAYQASAYQFGVWARRGASSFRAAGWSKFRGNLASVPRGAVIVWRPGQCGYHSTHGHIEVAIGGGRACSDFCGRIKTGCGMPEVFVPTKSSCD